VVAVAVEPVVVEPVHPRQGGELELVDVVPHRRGVGASDAVGLVEAVGGLGQGVDAPIDVKGIYAADASSPGGSGSGRSW
jgi:hypothetical protein